MCDCQIKFVTIFYVYCMFAELRNDCHERDGVEDSNAEDRSFNNKVKQNKEQKPPRRGKTSRQAEDWSTVKHLTHMTWTHERQRISTGLQTQGELYRETNEGNEGDTAGATETMIK